MSQSLAYVGHMVGAQQDGRFCCLPSGSNFLFYSEESRAQRGACPQAGAAVLVRLLLCVTHMWPLLPHQSLA